MSYVWRDGFHAPKGVDVNVVGAALAKLSEPSPEGLLEASKGKRHVLHETLWAEGDQVWANRGRLEHCRHIIGSVHETVVVGGRELTIRAVEFVRADGEGRWAMVDNIRDNPDMLDAYFAEVVKLQEQAAGKMEKLRELMKPE